VCIDAERQQAIYAITSVKCLNVCRENAMGSYAGLYIKKKEVFMFKNESYWSFGELFSSDELIHLKGKAAAPYATNWPVEEMDDEEIEDIVVYAYRARVSALKDRMELMGLTKDLAKKVLHELVEEQIASNADMIKGHFTRDKSILKKIKAENDYLSKMTYDGWCRDVKAWLDTPDRNHTFARGSVLENPLVAFDYGDERLLFRIILDQLTEDETIVLDLSEVYQGGWVKEDERKLNYTEEAFIKDASPPIIITEGVFDAYAIKAAIKVLKPHLYEYVRFLDYDQKNDGGASASVRLLRSLAAAGVSNRVLAIFDNDTSAHEELHGLDDSSLPENFKIALYPDLEFAKSYPTEGAQGRKLMNVNGLACSIEMFLGHDVLKDNEQFRPVSWKNRMPRTGQYQGEISGKSEVQKLYRDKVKLALKNGAQKSQDWSGMELLVGNIVKKLSTLPFSVPRDF